MVKARRGDIVAVVTTSHTYEIGKPRTETERVELARVVSVTRDGVVKRAACLDSETSTAYRTGTLGARVLVLPADELDMSTMVRDYCARRYPSAPHSAMVPQFSSLDECRRFVAGYRL